MMVDLWIPTATKAVSGSGRTGGIPRRPDAPPRGVIHTTETGPGSSKALVEQLQWPYHILADPFSGEITQLIPLNRTAYALRATSPTTGALLGFETNHMGSYCVQVSIVAKAAEIRRLTAKQLVWLADKVFKPIIDLTGIPNEWSDPKPAGYAGWILASEASPNRMSPQEWEACNRWTNHGEVPGQDHWDPGDLDVQSIQARIEATTIKEPVVLPDLGSPKGYVDSCKDLGNGIVEITGWAKDPDAPGVPLGIHIYRGASAAQAIPGKPDAVFVAGTSASLNREDPVGPHGFHIRLPDQPTGQTYRIYALNAPGSAGRNVELGQSPTVAKTAQTAPAPEPDPTEGAEAALAALERAEASIAEAKALLGQMQ